MCRPARVATQPLLQPLCCATCNISSRSKRNFTDAGGDKNQLSNTISVIFLTHKQQPRLNRMAAFSRMWDFPTTTIRLRTLKMWQARARASNCARWVLARSGDLQRHQQF